ncbi:MAG: hypothetical protein JO079_08125 [Frankiaceae bacterium]|nr:hypothetical protein [Frankiaceae bacterium]MBV9368665.1 hypothetical protein [Frankiales bacterium]
MHIELEDVVATERECPGFEDRSPVVAEDRRVLVVEVHVDGHSWRGAAALRVDVEVGAVQWSGFRHVDQFKVDELNLPLVGLRDREREVVAVDDGAVVLACEGPKRVDVAVASAEERDPVRSAG